MYYSGCDIGTLGKTYSGKTAARMPGTWHVWRHDVSILWRHLSITGPRQVPPTRHVKSSVCHTQRTYCRLRHTAVSFAKNTMQEQVISININFKFSFKFNFHACGFMLVGLKY